MNIVHKQVRALFYKSLTPPPTVPNKFSYDNALWSWVLPSSKLQLVEIMIIPRGWSLQCGHKLDTQSLMLFVFQTTNSSNLYTTNISVVQCKLLNLFIKSLALSALYKMEREGFLQSFQQTIWHLKWKYLYTLTNTTCRSLRWSVWLVW